MNSRLKVLAASVCVACASFISSCSDSDGDGVIGNDPADMASDPDTSRTDGDTSGSGLADNNEGGMEISGGMDPNTGMPPIPMEQPADGQGLLNVTFVDGCNDDSSIQLRLFEYIDQMPSGRRFPENNQVVLIEGATTFNLECATGTDVCYGANVRNDPGAGFWGVGIEGTEGCNNCCVTCPAGEVTVNPRELAC